MTEMTEPNLIARQRSLLREFLQRAAARGQAEPAIAEALRSESERVRQESSQAAKAIEDRLTAELSDAEQEVQKTRAAVQGRFEAEQEAARREHTVARDEVLTREAAEREASRAAYQEACWTIAAQLEATRTSAEEKLRDNKARLASRIEELFAVQQQARSLLQEWKQPARDIEADAQAEPPKAVGEGFRKLSDCLADAQGLLAELRGLAAPRYLRPGRFALLSALTWLVLVYPLGWLLLYATGWGGGLKGLLVLGVVAASLSTIALAAVAHWFLAARTRWWVRELYLPLCHVLLEAEQTRHVLLDRYKEDSRVAILEGKRKHNEDVRAAHTAYRRQRSASKQQRNAALPPIEERYRKEQTDSQVRRDAALREAEERYHRRCTEAQQLYEQDMLQLQGRQRQHLADIRARHECDWATLADAWKQTVAHLNSSVAEVNQQADRLFPAWDDPTWQDWKPSGGVPPVLRLGEYEVQLGQLPAGLPRDEELRALTPEVIRLPALCPFPGQASLLLEASDEGRARAVEALQATLFRLLTSLPAGKVRFVIVDPVGLGQNFAAFMHLADYDEQLVASRIWTEVPHVEQRLADLTAHMENVIQKYLRNRYASITDYNAEAGEVAEPFRILVVANFPVNFSADAARRLVSIAQSGPRCGVLTLISVDTKQPLPQGFDLKDLEQAGNVLLWEDGRFRWREPDFGGYPLTLEPPPPTDFANRILGLVGEAARGAHRVEVPFEFIAPVPEQWWQADSRRGIEVALGRAGATRRQLLQLGRGTAQHALVAGKTGSGKSTLLHALITNLALAYSPDEVELYLVDFKKGVEFKTYAAHQLPHARVIAIESEREFGLSVLQRLDAELKERADLFRDARAQDVNSYRQAVPDGRMPRIMLVVDEFQEFFVEDDRIAQEAAQLLDRLVRQGRAFGMHVLLGSQTLGGAYSLARSTIDQMAVRIALQCSEADAHLILSDDNSAARLLSRPGEAIYNDANGLVEGNNPFQVVWLGDERREHYLEQIHELTGSRPPRLQARPVVFEGNAPADVANNHLLNALLQAPLTEQDGRREQRAWLGEAMAINDLTAAPFRPQNGSNLLVVGQQEETVVGMLATALVGLAVQMPPAEDTGESARFYFVDGRQAETPTEGVPARLPEVIPQKVRLTGSREVPAVMAELSAELERRQKAGVAGPPVYVVLHALHRLRDLRRAEDDFGFGRREETVSPAQQFATLLREGPALGIHTLVWCDTLNNLQRALDRQSLREFALRVLFQMNVADSSNLIDGPQASKLGMHRALFFNEEDGRLDKFRPYGQPADAWLTRTAEQLHRLSTEEQRRGTTDYTDDTDKGEPGALATGGPFPPVANG
jgi:S-DNA-T family DNA segregation ATPase FtsK/SpoIIIE